MSSLLIGSFSFSFFSSFGTLPCRLALGPLCSVLWLKEHHQASMDSNKPTDSVLKKLKCAPTDPGISFYQQLDSWLSSPFPRDSQTSPILGQPSWKTKASGWGPESCLMAPWCLASERRTWLLLLPHLPPSPLAGGSGLSQVLVFLLS